MSRGASPAAAVAAKGLIFGACLFCFGSSIWQLYMHNVPAWFICLAFAVLNLVMAVLVHVPKKRKGQSEGKS